MRKAFDQTVRDLKRGVNRKVLKVPFIEQKILDATSNEPWGPHGTLLADIAQASRNYHEYQIIMTILWKRINDIGKNWRHVYKALIVLEYLVAHGSERVTEDIRERAYQIQTLSDFQYTDSSGRDQGNNVRKKSQILVMLVNDKERIDEVRQKAAANRDKFQNSSAGSMYRPGSHSMSGGYGERHDDRYGGIDEERNGYGREREYRYRDDDRYGDSYSRNGDRYSRESEDRYGRDDDYRRRSPSVDGSRSRSSDTDRDRFYEDNGHYSSRGSGARADDQSQDRSASGQKHIRNYSEQYLSAPPSYGDAVGGAKAVRSARSPTHSDRDGETSATAPKSSPPPASSSPAVPAQTSGTAAPAPTSSSAPAVNNKEADGYDEFDPRGTFPAVQTTSSGTPSTMYRNGETDLFASLPDSFTDNSSALVPTTSSYSTNEVDTSTNSSSRAPTQGFNDPFGDGPFKATPSTNGVPGQQQSFHSVPSPQNVSNSGPELPQQVSQNSAVTTFPGASSTSSGDTNIDILADILPLSVYQHPVNRQPEYPETVNQAVPQPMPQTGQILNQTTFPVQSAHHMSVNGFPTQSGQLVVHPNFSPQFGQSAPQAGFPVHNGQPASLAGYPNQSAQASVAGFSAQTGMQSQPSGQSVHPNAVPYANYNTQSGVPNMVAEVSSAPTSQQNATNFLASSHQFQAPQVASISTAPPAKDKFETRSTVWTDTLSRGLVNLNISGAKTNFDIGLDFDALNRKEKRMEKPAATPVTSTIHMGKAMGSASGIGRAGAGIGRPTSNPMMGASAGMGIGMAAPRPGVTMAGYGGMNQQPMGVGMGMNMAPNTGMGMNMGMGAQMQRPMGFPPGSTMSGGYNPMTGTGNYVHNPYGGGYR